MTSADGKSVAVGLGLSSSGSQLVLPRLGICGDEALELGDVTVSAPPNAAALDHLKDLGVDRAVVFVGPPFEQAVSRVRAVLGAK